LPPETAWASGASDQRIFILRRHRLTVAVANETDYPMDLAALNRVIATAIATLSRQCPPLSAITLAKSSSKASCHSGSECA
jgi:hypothetical protein